MRDLYIFILIVPFFSVAQADDCNDVQQVLSEAQEGFPAWRGAMNKGREEEKASTRHKLSGASQCHIGREVRGATKPGRVLTDDEVYSNKPIRTDGYMSTWNYSCTWEPGYLEFEEAKNMGSSMVEVISLCFPRWDTSESNTNEINKSKETRTRSRDVPSPEYGNLFPDREEYDIDYVRTNYDLDYEISHPNNDGGRGHEIAIYGSQRQRVVVTDGVSEIKSRKAARITVHVSTYKYFDNLKNAQGWGY